ncbi:hypothetical protein [Streptomyces sp. BPTC-684]|uniref:hypothetical protein n=1 Tax=Streptomyces sp. BPTC-684 TaxID=3043734 RepID=UPI0024B1C2FD|nr:hypothetical protein [Streptomyces sp. BPTC-684]WHM40471.1 hypothetical protein QIY60_28815 [Streptomyces sp. BPTC-684]
MRPPASAVSDGGGQDSPLPGDGTPGASSGAHTSQGTHGGSPTAGPGENGSHTSGSGGDGGGSSGSGSTGSTDPGNTGPSDPGKGSSPGSPGTGGKGGTGGGKSGPCGLSSPPTGTTGGRRTQTVVFPSPGTAHTFPHTSAALHACATSGLPVRYALGGDAGGCKLETANGRTTVAIRGNTGSCTVLAYQDGDATWAPAGPVRGDFAVGYQVVSISWADPKQPMHYPSGPVGVRVRVTSPDPFTGGMLTMTATGDCQLENNSYIGVNDPVVTVKVQPTKPSGASGVCTLNGAMGSDHTAKSVFLPERSYTVTVSRSAVPSP